MIKIRFTLNKKTIGFSIGNLGLYIHPQTWSIRTYSSVNGETLTKEYYINPIKQYRRRIERELTDKHLKVLRQRGI